ncbi:uncharacterized protein LOC142344563 isoform X5 [Convolutriloba macropyga]|uniref:uncharacterized protein LOC142344563 isoform X5 n=1 Tax=Convolutriloba macropyga TaxID=536237 RepID=UPI003F525C96
MNQEQITLSSFHSTCDFAPLTMEKLGIFEDLSFYDSCSKQSRPDLLNSSASGRTLSSNDTLERSQNSDSTVRASAKSAGIQVLTADHRKILVQRKPLKASWKLIERCFPHFFRPSWLSRSHESLVFNSVYSSATNQIPPTGLSNQSSESSGTNTNAESAISDLLSPSNNFPPLQSSHSQYFNSHHLGSQSKLHGGRTSNHHKHHHRPSLALDSNDNLLLGSVLGSSTNDNSALFLANRSSTSNLRHANHVNASPSPGVGIIKHTLTNDNYLHMNGGPNGMGPSPLVVNHNLGGGLNNSNSSSTTSGIRTSSTTNLQQMHSSTLEKQKLDSANRTATLRQTPSSMTSANHQSVQSLASSLNINNSSASSGAPLIGHQQQQAMQFPTSSTASVLQQQNQLAMMQQMPTQVAAAPGMLQAPREASSLRMHVLEMKGAPSKQKQRIYCQILVNGIELGQTTAKPKLDILFWGELFNFSPMQLSKVEPIKKIQIKIFKESDGKKKKKEVAAATNQLGTVELDMREISGDWHEAWYTVDNKAKSCEENCTLRVRAVYHTVRVLDLNCYNELLDFLREDSLLLYRVVEDAILLKEKAGVVFEYSMYLGDAESEDFSTSLIQVLHHCDKIDVFFADVIEYELKKEANPRMVFRGNSLATKSMEAYLKFIGSKYLKETLQQKIQSIYESNEMYEIDPQKYHMLTPKLHEQQRKFEDLCGDIWRQIRESIDKFPWEMKRVFGTIRNRLQNSYSPEVIDNIITGSVFLRFLCPAIMTPNFFGLHNAYPPDDTVRTLKLVAKLLQALANFSLLGDKESYMVFMNSFMQAHSDEMRAFLDDISQANSKTEENENNYLSQQQQKLCQQERPVEPGSIDVAKECAIIHRMLQKIKDNNSNSNNSSSSSVASVSRSGNMPGNPLAGSTAASLASPSKSGRSLAQIIHTIYQQHRFQHQSQMYPGFAAPVMPNQAFIRSYNQSPQPMMQQAMLAAGALPASYAPPGAGVMMTAGTPPVVPNQQYPPMTTQGSSMTPNVSQAQQQMHLHQQQQQSHPYNHFTAQPVRQASVDSQIPLRVEQPQPPSSSQSQFYPHYPPASSAALTNVQHYPNMSGDHMRIKAPTDMLHPGGSNLMENTYYNQPAALLHNSSHHVNSTLPRTNKHPSNPGVNRSAMGNIPGFSMPPPPNYPPPAPGDCYEENYENMEVVKMSNKHQNHQSPHKKNSAPAATSSSLTAAPTTDHHQIANPTSPFQPAMPEQAQRVRLNPSQSNSTINLQNSAGPNPDQSRQQQQRTQQLQQQSQQPSKSRLGVSSLSNFNKTHQAASAGKAQSPNGGFYDAADHYNASAGQIPTATVEPFKAVSRSATRTPTSEVANLTTMPVQYANSETIQETMGSRDEMLGAVTPTAKSPSTVPVQIIPETRNFRSHTPTGGSNEQRQTSSHGDFMTLANPIYDVYNSEPCPVVPGLDGHGRFNTGEDPQSMRRSDSVSTQPSHRCSCVAATHNLKIVQQSVPTVAPMSCSIITNNQTLPLLFTAMTTNNVANPCYADVVNGACNSSNETQLSMCATNTSSTTNSPITFDTTASNQASNVTTPHRSSSPFDKSSRDHSATSALVHTPDIEAIGSHCDQFVFADDDKIYSQTEGSSGYQGMPSPANSASSHNTTKSSSIDLIGHYAVLHKPVTQTRSCHASMTSQTVKSPKSPHCSCACKRMSLPSGDNDSQTRDRDDGSMSSRNSSAKGSTTTTGEDEESPTTMDTPDEMAANESLENVFVPQSTTDCLMPSMSFRRQHNSSTGSQGSQHLQHQQKFRAPVVAPEECDGPEEAGTRVGDSNSQDDVTYTIRAGNDSDPSNCNTSQQSFITTLNNSTTGSNACSSDHQHQMAAATSSNSLATISSSIPPLPTSNSSGSSPNNNASESSTNRRRSQLYANRTPAVKSVGEYAADNDKLQNRVSELEEREVAAQQERKAVEAKNKAMHEDISRLNQENSELKSQMDNLAFELRERDKLIAGKDEKIRKLLKTNQSLLESWEKAKQLQGMIPRPDSALRQPVNVPESNSGAGDSLASSTSGQALIVTNGSAIIPDRSSREVNDQVNPQPVSSAANRGGRETPTQSNNRSRYQSNGPSSSADIVKITKGIPLELQNSTPL